MSLERKGNKCKRKGAIARPFPSVTESSSLPSVFPLPGSVSSGKYRLAGPAFALRYLPNVSACQDCAKPTPDRTLLRSPLWPRRFRALPKTSIHQRPVQRVKFSLAMLLKARCLECFGGTVVTLPFLTSQSHPLSSSDVEIAEMWKSCCVRLVCRLAEAATLDLLRPRAADGRVSDSGSNKTNPKMRRVCANKYLKNFGHAQRRFVSFPLSKVGRMK